MLAQILLAALAVYAVVVAGLAVVLLPLVISDRRAARPADYSSPEPARFAEAVTSFGHG